MDNEVRRELIAKSCKPLPVGAPSLSMTEVARLSLAVPQWNVTEKNISREYQMSSYMSGVRWFALLASLADGQDHHPDALITWCRVKITLWTHTVGGLSENDFILAAKLDRAWDEFMKQESQR